MLRKERNRNMRRWPVCLLLQIFVSCIECGLNIAVDPLFLRWIIHISKALPKLRSLTMIIAASDLNVVGDWTGSTQNNLSLPAIAAKIDTRVNSIVHSEFASICSSIEANFVRFQPSTNSLLHFRIQMIEFCFRGATD